MTKKAQENKNKKNHVKRKAHGLGRCARCNHWIWTPKSLKDGLGQICKEKGFDAEFTVELKATIAELARQILDEQKYRTPAPFRRKVHSSFSLWSKNKKLTEGW